MLLQQTPFSIPLYFTTEVLRGSAEEVYTSVKRDALRNATAGFADEPLEGQLIHSAYAIGHGGLSELGLKSVSLLIADVWQNPQVIEAAIRDRIGPALGVAGLPDPAQVADVELIGCIGSPDVADFRTGQAIASVLVWPDLGVDVIELYSAAFEEVIGDDKPLIEGSGTHVAYRTGNQIVTLEIWRSREELQHGMDHRIMPGVGLVFSKFGVEGQPRPIQARALGIATIEEVRYPATS